MNDREILEKLWEACRETPFSSFSLQRKLDLRPQEETATRSLLVDMADSREVKHGYRIKLVESTMYKLIPQAQGDSERSADTAEAMVYIASIYLMRNRIK